MPDGHTFGNAPAQQTRAPRLSSCSRTARNASNKSRPSAEYEEPSLWIETVQGGRAETSSSPALISPSRESETSRASVLIAEVRRRDSDSTSQRSQHSP